MTRYIRAGTRTHLHDVPYGTVSHTARYKALRAVQSRVELSRESRATSCRLWLGPVGYPAERDATTIRDRSGYRSSRARRGRAQLAQKALAARAARVLRARLRDRSVCRAHATRRLQHAGSQPAPLASAQLARTGVYDKKSYGFEATMVGKVGVPCRICVRTGLTPATSASGLGSPLPHLRRGLLAAGEGHRGRRDAAKRR
jgi:hypothetical protein